MSFSGSGVKLMSDGVTAALGEAGHPRALGQILADESVGVFTGASLPTKQRVIFSFSLTIHSIRSNHESFSTRYQTQPR